MDYRFEDIRVHEGSQHRAFEELVRQLAHRDPPRNAKEFRRIEGAGGDGGVEAYWLLSNGRKIGYQAKFFTRSRDIDWSQLDGSFQQALKTHPELKRYVVSLACDLTDRSGNKKGFFGWQHWDRHKAKWKKWAKAKGLSVDFELWSKGDLGDRLIDPRNRGLAEYWFRSPLFDQAWFIEHFNAVKADLDERYHPEDHVELSASKLFQGLARSVSFVQELLDRFEELADASDLRHRLTQLKVQPDITLLKDVNAALDQIHQINATADATPHVPLPVDSWQTAIRHTVEKIQSLERWLWADSRQTENPGEHGEVDYTLLKARHAVTALEESLRRLQRRLDEIDVKGDCRAGLVIGAAGTGKSHLFADAVSKAIGEGRPALLLLGQYFHTQDLFRTILDKFGIGSLSPEAFLGALDAAAEATHTRCLIVVDAVNDAHNLKYLRDHIGSFLGTILQHKHLALALSCRAEYERSLLPGPIQKQLVRVECHGFVSQQEQEAAAQQYLEKRSIVRPATPWLAPEFRNPLFLRTCCEALRRSGKHEFPRGLRGIKEVFRFYLESIEDSLRRKYPGVHIVPGSVGDALCGIAKRMAEGRTDSVSRNLGQEVTSKAFGNEGPSLGNSWLDVLIREGVLRRDLDPTDGSDPLDFPQEVTRFAYQRFSDHLIVAALLQASRNPTRLFSPGGPLRFLITDHRIEWRFQSLLPALATQIPEAFRGKELLDILPGGPKQWWKYPVTEAFGESILWRSKEAFSKRTLELFNALGSSYSDPRLSYLFHLSVVKDHPWNAYLIDKNLRKRKMPQRDAFWSVPLARITDNEEHPLHGLIDWALRADKTGAEDETLRLTSLVLTWCFTTSSRPIRDRATKALSTVLVSRPVLFVELLHRFASIDDLYILERICAAGFGAACHGIGKDALSATAEALFKVLFKDKRPPLNLLLRDYALAVIELAKQRGCLARSVDLGVCRPPYKSSWPLKKVTEGDINKARKAAGSDSIYYSASGFGDFARYEIETRIEDFSSVVLSETCPLNEKQKLEKFRTKIKNWSGKKQAAFAGLESAVDEWKNSTTIVTRKKGFSISIRRDSKLAEKAGKAERRLIMLLSASEKSLYRHLVVPAFFPDRADVKDRDIPKFEVGFAKRWVTKRSYDFGWTKQLFPEEPRGGIDRDRPLVERIGKKYQWLARSELMSRLADNVWMIKQWPDEAFVYGHSCHTDFVRDIEPTILKPASVSNHDHPVMWWFRGSINYQAESDEAAARWPFENSELLNRPELIEVKNSEREDWLVLSSFYHSDERLSREYRDIPFRRTAFVRISSIIIRPEDVGRLVNGIKGKRLTDPTHWNPREAIDGPFYLEYPWRHTWSGIEDTWADEGIGYLGSLKIGHVNPVIDYRWESQLDKTLPKGSSVRMPSLWLSKQLGLAPLSSTLGQFADKSGKLIFLDPSVGTEFPHAALIDRDLFLTFLKKRNLECLWVIAGEKSTHLSHLMWSRRWYSGVYRRISGKWVGGPWYGDESSGLDKYLKKLRKTMEQPRKTR